MSKFNKWLAKQDEIAILGWIAGIGLFGYFIWDVYLRPLIADFVGDKGAQVPLSGGTFLDWHGVLQIGIYFFIFLILVVVILFISTRIYYTRRARKEVRYLQILPHRRTSVSAEKVDLFMMDLHKRYRVWYRRLIRGREWFRWLIYCNPETKEIEFYLGYPQDKESGVKNCFHDHFPNAELFPVSKDDLPLPERSVFK